MKFNILNSAKDTDCPAFRIAAWILLLVWGCTTVIPPAYASGPVPANKPPEYPSWWFERSMIPRVNPGEAAPTYPGSYKSADDYAVANRGQLKHVATAAYDELERSLPDGAGPDVELAIKRWYMTDEDTGEFVLDAGKRIPRITTATDDFAALNLGQLKNTALPFYQRLQSRYPGQYPWPGTGATPDDSAVANLGQLKKLFSFDLAGDANQDGIPDWWMESLSAIGVEGEIMPTSMSGILGDPTFRSGSADFGTSPLGDPNGINATNTIFQQESLFQASMVGREPPQPPIIHFDYGFHDLPGDFTRIGMVILLLQEEVDAHPSSKIHVYRKTVPGDPTRSNHTGAWTHIGEVQAASSTTFIDDGRQELSPGEHDTGLKYDERYYYRVSFAGSRSNQFGYSPPRAPIVTFVRTGADGSSSNDDEYQPISSFLQYAYEKSHLAIPVAYAADVEIGRVEVHNYFDEGQLASETITRLPEFEPSSLQGSLDPLSETIFQCPLWLDNTPYFRENSITVDQAGNFMSIDGMAYARRTKQPVMDGSTSHSFTCDSLLYTMQVTPAVETSTSLFRWQELFFPDPPPPPESDPNEPPPPLPPPPAPISIRSHEIIAEDSAAPSDDFTIIPQIDNGNVFLVSDVDLLVQPAGSSDVTEENELPDSLEHLIKLEAGESIIVRARVYSTEYVPYNLAVTWAGSGFVVSDANTSLNDDPDRPPIFLSPGNYPFDGYPNSRIAFRITALEDAPLTNEPLTFSVVCDVGGVSLGEASLSFRLTRDRPKPGESYAGPAYTMPVDEATGAAYRKIALNGRPLSDHKPQQNPESDQAREETFIDALGLGLRHSTSDIYVPVPGADFALQVRRNAVPEIWTIRSGLRPHERPDRPFGAGWRTNVCPTLEIVDHYSDPAGLSYAYVTDYSGAGHRFVHATIGQNSYWLPLPSGAHEQSGRFVTLAREWWTDEQRWRWVFSGQNGSKIYFEDIPVPGTASERTPILRHVRANREHGSEATMLHSFYRAHSVEDRLGNTLLFGYTGNPSLVPTTIHSGATLKLSIRQDTEGNITDIWDPNGNRWVYEYDIQRYFANGRQYVERDLVRVRGPDWRSVQYHTSFVLEPDTTTPPIPDADARVLRYHWNLARITDPRNNAYEFTYEFDQTVLNFHSTAGYYVQPGRPRWVKSVALPDGVSHTHFKNRPDEGWALKLGYDSATQKFAVASVPGRYAQITDAEQNVTTYSFKDPVVLELNELEAALENPMFVPKVVCYQEMQIAYDGFGSETFKFNISADLSLSEVKDLSGNVTKFLYETLKPSGTGWQILIGANHGPTYETDVTRQINADLRPKLFYYQGLPAANPTSRILRQITDEEGVATVYTLDSKGRRTAETLVKNGAPVRATSFKYENATFPGVVTARIIEKHVNDTSVPRAIRTNYGLDTNGRVMTETVDPTIQAGDGRLNIVTSHTYDPNGNRLSTTDPKGKRTGFSYDERNRLTMIEYPGRYTKHFDYDNNGNKTREIDENGNITDFVFDALNRLTDEIRGESLIHYGYNAVNSRTSVIDPNENETISKYDALQRLEFVVNPDENRSEMQFWYEANSGASAFDSSGFKPTRVKDFRGTITDYVYDKLYRERKRTVTYEPGKTAVWEKDYDAVGNLTWERDPLWKITEHDYNPASQLTKTTFADSSFIELHYSSTGLKVKETNERLFSTVTTYDGAGRPIKVTGPVEANSPVTETEYDAAGNVTAVIDPRQKRTEYIYDVRNRKIKEVLPAVLDPATGNMVNPLRRYAYDGVGNVIASADSRDQVTFTRYDDHNRVTMIQPPAPGGRTTMRYDRAGNVKAVFDANGHKTKNLYDELNRLSFTQDAEGIGVQYRYDPMGNRTKVIDGKFQVTEFAYDGLGRVTSVKDQVNPATLFHYNGVNKTERVDSLGRTTKYFYDDRHRLESVQYIGRSVDNRTYGYDDAGNLETVTEPALAHGGKTNVAYTYDALNRVVTETSGGVLHRYEYDKAGNRDRVTYGEGSAAPRVMESVYDALNRMTQVTEANRPTSYKYDLNGNVLKKTLPNLDVVITSYDALNRARVIEGRNAPTVDHPQGQQLYEYGLEYDRVGNVVENRETYLGEIAPRVLSMGYDKIGRLIHETESVQPDGAPVPIVTVTSYVYDDAHNRASKSTKVGLANPVTVSYTSNPLNQLTQKSGAEERTYEYDANGNRVLRERPGGAQDVYTYDYENRLVKVVAAGVGQFDYLYDYRTRRVEVKSGADPPRKVVFSGGVSVREYEGTNPQALTVEYVRGSDMGGGVGGILYTLRGSAPSFTHYNNRGDVTAKTDGTGELTYQASYQAFGTRRSETGATADRQKANTKEEDPTGLLNEGFRYRDLDTGVFLTRDPAGFVDGPNLYTYVRQNPWSKFDPEGLSEQDVFRSNPIDRMRDAFGELKGVLKGGQRWGGQKTVPQKIADKVTDHVIKEVERPLAVAEAATRVANSSTLGGPSVGTPPVDPRDVAVVAQAAAAAVDSAPSESAAAAKAKSEAAADSGGHLVRFGKGPETAEKLAQDAQKAEETGRFPHGVSTRLKDRVSGSDKAHRSAPKSQVEKVFEVQQTGKDPRHHTVVLPKPVTEDVADKFNKTFPPRQGE